MAPNNVIVTYPCVRAMLLLFNITFWFCGLAFVWAGVWMHTDLQYYLKISSEYTKAAPLVLVTIGTIILFVTTLACSCIVKVQQTLLVIYGAFLVMILFAVITISAYIYTYKDQLSDGLASGIQDNIRHYNNLPPNHVKAIDFVQKTLKCCGSKDYLDWLESPQKMPPHSCCMSALSACNPQNPKLIYKSGCMPKLVDLVNTNLTLIGATASAIALFPLFGTMLTFCLASTSSKYGYEPLL